MALDGDTEQDLGIGESSPYAAHLDRGWSLLTQGDFAGARRSGQGARELLPEDPDACLLLAAVAQSEHRYEQALEHYREAIELDPEYPEAYLCTARMLIHEAQAPEQALPFLEEASTLDEMVLFDQIELTLLRAEAVLDPKASKPAQRIVNGCEAIEALHDLMHAPRDDAAMQTLLETLCEWNGVPPEDAQELEDEELQALLDKLALHCFRLARIDLEGGRENRAAVLLRALLGYLPDHVDAWHLLGDCEFRRGQHQAAVQAALKVQALDTQAPSPRIDWDDARLQQAIRERYTELVRTPPLNTLEQELALDMTVLDRPGVELLYEGLDPRALFIVLRPGLPGEQGPAPATLVIYRENLLRLMQAGDKNLPEDVDEQLEEALRTQLDL